MYVLQTLLQIHQVQEQLPTLIFVLFAAAAPPANDLSFGSPLLTSGTVAPIYPEHC
jgi:hypothetical protein